MYVAKFDVGLPEKNSRDTSGRLGYGEAHRLRPRVFGRLVAHAVADWTCAQCTSPTPLSSSRPRSATGCTLPALRLAARCGLDAATLLGLSPQPCRLVSLPTSRRAAPSPATAQQPTGMRLCQRCSPSSTPSRIRLRARRRAPQVKSEVSAQSARSLRLNGWARVEHLAAPHAHAPAGLAWSAWPYTRTHTGWARVERLAVQRVVGKRQERRAFELPV